MRPRSVSTWLRNLLGCSMLLAASTAFAAGLTETWRMVWEDFSRTYSYFDHKRINWDAVWQSHETAFDAVSDPTEFAVKLNDILQVLRDWHVAVGKPDGQFIGFRGEVTPNYHPTKIIFSRYSGGTNYQNLKSAGAIAHARINGNIGHVLVLTLGDRFTQNITDSDLEQLFLTSKDAAGLILDLRANTGGDENNARRLVSFLNDAPRIYGYSRTRIPGPDRTAFTDFTARQVNSRGPPIFTGPVVGLIGQRTISSAEAMALMIRSLPNSILIGDTTRGASGNPVVRTIPALGVTYTISTWIAYDAERVAYEGIGIVPEIRVPASSSYDDERDYVLERAIEYIANSKGTTLGVPNGWIFRHGLTLSDSSDADSDGLLDRHEWLAGTHPRDRGSSLRVLSIRAATSSVVVRWSSVPGKRYTLQRAGMLSGGGFQRVGSVVLAESKETETTAVIEPRGEPALYRIELIAD